MSVLTLAQMRTRGMRFVRNTSVLNNALSPSDWNEYINDAMLAYAIEAEGDDVLVDSLPCTLARGDDSFTADFTGRPVPLGLEEVYLVGIGRLARRPPPVIRTARAENPTDTGQPTLWAPQANLERTSWTVLVDMKADRDYDVDVWYRIEPDELVNDSDLPPFGSAGSRVIARLAAIDAAPFYGRPPEFIDRLSQSLPERMRAAKASGFRGAQTGGADGRRAP